MPERRQVLLSSLPVSDQSVNALDTAKPQSGPYLLFSLALSLFTLGMLATDALFKLDMRTREIIAWLDNGVCLLFFMDFALSFWRAESKSDYFFKWGWLDLLSSIPMIDSLRWGRLARIFRIFRILRGMRSAKLLAELAVQRRAESALLTAALLSLLLLVFAAITILQLETAPTSNIRSAEDALWWSVTTITTVGYGDLYPVTSAGRLLAGLLMIAGVGLFGALSGLVAAWLLRPAETRQEADLDALQAEIEALRLQLRLLAPSREERNPRHD
jgi:voltage-gated potassium channel